MNLRASLDIQNAAWREATRNHEAETDLDHVFLGLLALGGPGAAALGAEGIGLAASRRALQSLRSRRLHGLGIDPAIAHRPPRPARELNRDDAGHVPLTGRAKRFLDQRLAQPSPSLLLALVTEPSSGVPALIEELGVSPARARERLHAVTEVDEPAARGDFAAPTATSLPTLPGVRLSRYVSCAPATAVAVASRAELAQHWLALAEHPTAERPDLVQGTTKGRHGQAQRIHDDPPVWVETWDGSAGGWWQVGIDPAQGGSLVTLTRTLRTRGVLARIAARAGQSLQSWTLTHALQNFAYACADQQDGPAPGSAAV